MNITNEIKRILKIIMDNIHNRRKVILGLSCTVVFITTYLLILPAFTLEKTEAAEQGGIDVPQSEETLAEESLSEEAEETESSAESEEKNIQEEAIEETAVAVPEEASKEEAEPAEESQTSLEGKAVEEAVEEESNESSESGTDEAEGKTDEVTDQESDNADQITVDNENNSRIAEEADPLLFEGDGYTVSVVDKDHILPPNTEIRVEEIDEKLDEESYKQYVSDSIQAVNDDETTPRVSDLKFARFYDITLVANGKEITTPKDAVSVRIEYDKELSKAMNVEDPEKLHVIHFAEDKKTGEVEPEILDNKDVEVKTDKKDLLTDATFEAESFSVYAVVYTVDFHWDVDGKKYDFSIPGGGFVSLEQLVDELGLCESETNTENCTNPETAKNFVADVESVQFSNPELVWAGKVNETITVGKLKEANGLEIEYSADLTEEQIREINAQTVEAGGWALIGMHPFTSEETLTVTMKNGEQFTVKVTDAQISTNVLTADGKTYKITITFDEKAEIPAGTQLKAEEIEPGTKEYIQHLGKAWSEVNKDYLEQEELKRNNKNGLDEYEDIRPVNLDDARFFDVQLIHNGEEIEPKVPVHVEIEYVDGLETDCQEKDQVIGVAHYKEDATELITDLKTETDADGKIIEFDYDQESFSDIGTYVGQKTYDNAPYKMNSKLAMPLLKALSNARGGNQLKDIEAHKSLSNNEDGTYTMSLTVKGDSVANEEYTKANILFVMDRSSSMKNTVYAPYKGPYVNGTTYYGSYDGGKTAFALSRIGNSFYYGYTPYQGTVYTAVSRLKAEQAAMDVLIQYLLNTNDPDDPDKKDLIEISVVSFAKNRCSGNTEYLDWTSDDYQGLMDAINQTNAPSGTNWEDALIYAREQAAAKKKAQPDEDVFVIFLTDGEPTAVYGESNGANHYINNYNQTLEGGFEYALTEEGGPYNSHGRIEDGKNALDRAKEIVDDGCKFYGIFTFNPGEAQTRYLRRLINFAYTGVDKAYENDQTKEETEIVKKYFTNADTPEALTDAFERIFADVSSTLGHGDVVIHDGLQSADAMTTTIHAGKADGYRYSVTDESGTELYYVTATGGESNPTVTFYIDGQPYETDEIKKGVDEKPYYSVTVGGTEYKMALADLTGRELTWDLSAIGTLLPGCTYKVDVIVWPNQAAYDYVAGLNNNLDGYVWNSEVESDPDKYHEVTVDGVTYGYYTDGVPDYPSIVKYKDTGVFSVLTNTHQELNYSIVNTKTNEVTGETTTTSDPQDPIPLEPQKPMDLVDTKSSIEKQWNIDLDPTILAQLLYPSDGSHYTLSFDVLQDDSTVPYTTLQLGWDETQNKYIWEEGSEVDIEYNDQTYSIGTRWKEDFAIPTGLMLSEQRMDALGMDKSAYPSGTFPADPEDPESELITYYVLETGHDYTIKENNLSYEFDFNADVFHPMLVDGKMQNVIFESTGNKTISISEMTNSTGGLSSLKVENTLRGYIHLQKVVVDENGRTLDSDKTKFEYNLVLTNDDGPFVDTHIPWYGINSLFYHDADFNYYQADYYGTQLKLKTEDGSVYNATGPFDKNYAGAQTITYDKDGTPVEVTLYGNQTKASNNNKTASATLKISQGEILSIANVPAGTEYTITETENPGYSLIGIERTIDPDDVEEDDEPVISVPGRQISGTIVPNHHNWITYTNKCLVVDISILKTDMEGTGLPGAVFQLKSVNGMEESPVTGVDGLDTVTKDVDGRERSFESAFETTGEEQVLSGLPDGTYRLYEVYVPAGYVNTLDYIEFTIHDRAMTLITDDAKVHLDPASGNQLALLTIKNEPGASLPNSGGIGTTIFYIFGSILVLVGGIYFIARRHAAL